MDWSSQVKSSNDASTPLPASQYLVEVNRASHALSSNSKLMFKIRFKVLVGPHAGRTVFTNLVVSPDSPGAMKWFFRKMSVLGATQEFFATNPTEDAVVAKISGARAQIQVDQRTWGEEIQNDVSKIDPIPVGTQLPPTNPSNPGIPTPSAPAPDLPPPTPVPAGDAPF